MSATGSFFTELPAPSSLLLDRKSEFRRVCEEQLAESVHLPRGVVCKSYEDGLTAILEVTQDGRAIAKPDDGESGLGHLVFERSAEPDSIASMLRSAAYLSFPFVVEELIEVGLAPCSPSVEICVSGEALCHLYDCAQVLSPEGDFLGVEIGEAAVPGPAAAKARIMAESVGSLLRDSGFRGHFDVDFVVDGKDRVYAVEANLRRTGGTHVHALAERILGPGYWERAYIRSFEHANFPAWRGMDAGPVFDRLGDLLVPDRGSDGVIVTATAGLAQGRISYAVVGPDGEAVDQLCAETESRLTPGPS